MVRKINNKSHKSNSGLHFKGDKHMLKFKRSQITIFIIIALIIVVSIALALVAFKKPNLQMRSVWAIGTPKPIEKKFGKHPTQKPEDLLKRIVLASTNKSDLILDPFTGSSTTGTASYLFGRNFIGIDTEPKFLDVSIKRFEELDKNLKNKHLKS